jgi:CRISPR-associated endonuclease/helicase Cas3
MQIGDDVVEVLWGKSARSGGPSRLIQHLYDTAAVAQLVWRDYLPPHLKTALDDVFEGRGEDAYVWVAGLHDLGKASPAFQRLDPELVKLVTASGLPVGRCRDLPHPVAGFFELRSYLSGLPAWKSCHVDWYSQMVLGHHGMFTSPGGRDKRKKEMGDERWTSLRHEIIRRVNAALELDNPPAPVGGPPSRSIQLSLSAAVSMADWIASDSSALPALWLGQTPSFGAAQTRAERAWRQLNLRGGWNPNALGQDNLMERRFGREPRPVQTLSSEIARTNPGLMIVEAPTGDGKTEAALVAAEILARMRSCDGLYVGMPTQATSDPMFKRVLDWSAAVDASVPIGLLHGKSQLNPDYQALLNDAQFSGVDEFGCDDPYGLQGEGHPTGSRSPSQWFLGRRRGMLMPVVVGTIDQLLMAATRTRYVGFRHLGLAGKVVVLDEIHACDVYMGEFLFEALRWLAQARIPVVVLTATLPPSLRVQLVRSYTQGLRCERDIEVYLPEVVGYPRITAVADDGSAAAAVVDTTQADRTIEVGVLDAGEGWAGLIQELHHRLDEGGSALVICNAVGRAQDCYRALKTEWFDEVVLLHGRLTAGTRARRTQQLLQELGPPSPDVHRPRRRIIVSTQVAEQSFDVDADLLVTDIAPMDLLIQRAGRLHRHLRAATDRGPKVERPAVLIMGLERRGEGPPDFDPSSEHIYGRWDLLSSALDVLRAREWHLPSEAPGLVGAAYERQEWPASWRGDAEHSLLEREKRDGNRVHQAGGLLLAGEDQLPQMSLAGLHERLTQAPSDEAVHAIVRDGAPSSEVILLSRDETSGEYFTITGMALGINGDLTHDPAVVEGLLSCTVRLPASQDLTADVERQLGPLPGWRDHPWLGTSRALILGDRPQELGGYVLSFDADLGLVSQKAGRS